MNTKNKCLTYLLASYFYQNRTNNDLVSERKAYEHLCSIATHFSFHSFDSELSDYIVSKSELLESIKKYLESKQNQSREKWYISLKDLYSMFLNRFNVISSDIVHDSVTYQYYLFSFASENGITVKQLELDIMYLLMCKVVSTRSKAKRLKVGEMIVTRQGSILIGYNGTAPNTSNECEYTDPDTGKLVSYDHVICGLQNAVYKSSRDGVSTVGSTAYSSHSPCVRCVPVALSVGIERFVYVEEYRLTEHLKQLTDNNVKLLKIPQEILDLYQKYN